MKQLVLEKKLLTKKAKLLGRLLLCQKQAPILFVLVALFALGNLSSCSHQEQQSLQRKCYEFTFAGGKVFNWKEIKCQ